MSDLHHLTATAMREALRTGEIDTVELTEHYLRRIETHNPVLGAYLTVAADTALAEAERARTQLRALGAAAPPLLGLPVPIKDLHPTAGVRTTMGSRAFAGFVPSEDAWTVGLIRRAGATMLGKTNVPEFGPTCYTENDLGLGPAVTPYDVTRYASGSSGGAAAAVAAGLAPVAHASDGAGSIRTPASTCGLVGFKPSRGTVSSYPQTALASVSIEGPIARTLADAALLGDVMAVPPPGEIWPDPRPATAPSLSGALRDPAPRGLRVGWWTDPGMPGVDPHPAVVTAVHDAVTQLRMAGHSVEEIAVPARHDPEVVRAIVMRFALAIGAGASLLPEGATDLFRPLSRWFLDIARSSTGVDVAMCDAVLSRFATTALTALAPYDVVVCPTASAPPVPVGWFSAEGLDAEPERMLGWSSGTPFANLTGYGALSLPLGWTDDGLPMGVQLAMAPGRDHELFAVAAQLLDPHLPVRTPPMF